MTEKLLDNGRYIYILTDEKTPLSFDKANEEDIEQLEEIVFLYQIQGLDKLSKYLSCGMRNGKDMNYLEKWSSLISIDVMDCQSNGETWCLPSIDIADFNKAEIRNMRNYFNRDFPHLDAVWYYMHGWENDLMIWKEFFKMDRRDYRPLTVKNIVEDYRNDFVAYDTLITWDISKIGEESSWNKRLSYVRREFPTDIPYEHHFQIDDWIFRAPNSYEEVVVEGRLMNHCVGGNDYLKAIRDEDTEIYFMRKHDDPHTPYITIEVENCTITQHFRKANRDPYPHQRAIIEEWAEEMGFDIDIKYSERDHYGG